MLKYQRWYDHLIERARGRKIDVYIERHHIIPRAWGGSDDPDNLVDLTYREHFLAHWLLTKTCRGRDKMLMAYALHCMSFSIAGRIVAGWQFEIAKRTLRREYLIRAKERYERRRARMKQEWTEAQASAARATEVAPGLHFRTDRGKLNMLTVDWLKGHPSRRLHRNKRSQNVNVKAKRIIAEANKVLELSPEHGFDMFEPEIVGLPPSPPKQKRNRHGKRERIALRTGT